MAVVALRRAQDLHRLRDVLSSVPGVAGISRPASSADLTAAVRQARSAASVAVNRAGPQVLLFDELGVLRLLVPLGEGPELANYVEDELGPLLQHDAASSHPLLPTLRSFVACGGNKSATAEDLVVQRRTLYYRLDRIAKVLEKDLDNAEHLQAITFAVRGLDLLGGPDRDR